MEKMQDLNAIQDTVLSSNSRNVLSRHLTSFQNNDLQALMSDYTNESVLVTQDAIYKGQDQIEAFFAGLIEEFPKQTSTFKLDKVIVKDELVYIVWHGQTPTLDVPFATDTFIIRNGKILRQTFAGQLKFVN
jgi:hypothetical protein